MRLKPMQQFKCLLYNESEMLYYPVFVQSVTVSPGDYTNVELAGLTNNDAIELDKDTMKLIAKYNKTKELRDIQSDIRRAKNDLKYYEKQVVEMQKKLNKAREAFDKIFD